MLRFAIATLVPALLLLPALWGSGVWVWPLVIYMTVLTATLDALIRRTANPDPEVEFPLTDPLSATLALLQIAALPLVALRLGGGGLGPAQGLALFVGAGLWFGQTGNANAHELIHRGRRGLRLIGIVFYGLVLFGHHASAHPLVHHIRVATREDPNTARRGESYYRFARRAWVGSFREGLRAEEARRRHAGRPVWRNPYLAYGALAACGLGVSWVLGGWPVLAAHLALAFYTQAQLLMSDYVQHYGLTRQLDERGKPRPVAPADSWDSPHWFSASVMMNAPRHGDHHLHPMRPYPNLQLGQSPMLPHGLPVMAMIALWPGLWRRVMDPLLPTR